MDRPGGISELFVKKENGRFYTLSVDPDTYAIICRVAKATGKSRPSVLAAFVTTANEVFKQEAESKGLSLDGVVGGSVRTRRRGRPPIIRNTSLEP